MTKSTRIFIVEDEALISMELEDRLTRMGFTVCGTTTHGEKALEEIPSIGTDVVLMDVKLAGTLSGIETAERLRERCDARIIFLTAYADDEMLRKVGHSHSSGLVTKPIDPDRLRRAIEAARA